MSINLLHGDCLEQMKTLEDNSVDAIVSDPPYGISFMAKKWDYDVPSVEVWKEAMRVLKPGGHALIACGTRTQHRMVCNIEDAGFEIRDVVSWIYGSGFPKSLNISKSIDKAAGVEREVIHSKTGAKPGTHGGSGQYGHGEDRSITAPATDEAKQWDGWGTALKPACEFFTLCRKPLSESTVAKNVLKWGTGGINIDGCRVGTEKIKINGGGVFPEGGGCTWTEVNQERTGRFPANLIHDGSQEVLDLFPENVKGAIGMKRDAGQKSIFNLDSQKEKQKFSGAKTDSGSAARFFYCPKASKKDRNEGCEELEEHDTYSESAATPMRDQRKQAKRSNNHPTVKPTALMAYLCRLITPTGGVVLDPYMGSGSTGKAAVREGFSFVGIELDPDYYEICKSKGDSRNTRRTKIMSYKALHRNRLRQIRRNLRNRQRWKSD
jgi:DNA modification methylase